MKEEYLDILDEKGEMTGVSRSYKDAHSEGLIHKAVHVWIINSEKKILLQKRAPKKVAWPNCWDISVGGHVSAGQTSVEGAQREVQEELGLDLPAEAFKYLFTLQESDILNDGAYNNNEFDDVYLVNLDTATPDIVFTDGEVSEVKWMSVEEFESWVNDKDSRVVPHDEEYAKLIEYLKQ